MISSIEVKVSPIRADSHIQSSIKLFSCEINKWDFCYMISFINIVLNNGYKVLSIRFRPLMLLRFL